MDLGGKVAIVTGAGRGLGWAIAERLAADGARLVLADLDRRSGEEKAEALRKMRSRLGPLNRREWPKWRVTLARLRRRLFPRRKEA